MTRKAAARFNRKDHATRPGWATYHSPANQRRAWACRIMGHQVPPKPTNADGYSPSNYANCQRCQNVIHWYVKGQHRWGGMAALEAEAARAAGIARLWPDGRDDYQP